MLEFLIFLLRCGMDSIVLFPLLEDGTFEMQCGICLDLLAADGKGSSSSFLAG